MPSSIFLERVWTYEAFVALLEEDSSRIPRTPRSNQLLWRLLKAWAAFPFPLTEDIENEALDLQSYLRVVALLRRGRSVLSEPDSSLEPRRPINTVLRHFRSRGRKQGIRFIFQALADIAPVQEQEGRLEIETPPVATTDENVDLVDVMAACMDISTDRYAWFAEDFNRALAQLPSSRSVERLRGRMDHETFKSLVQLVDSMQSARRDERQKSDGENATLAAEDSDDDGPTIPRFEITEAEGEGVSWPSFSQAVEEIMV